MDWLGVVAIVLAALVAGFVGVLVLAARGRRPRTPRARHARHDLLTGPRPRPAQPRVIVEFDDRGLPLPPVARPERLDGQPSGEPAGSEQRNAALARKAALDHRERVNLQKAYMEREERSLTAKVKAEEKAYQERLAAAEVALARARAHAVQNTRDALETAEAMNRRLIGGGPGRGVVVWEHQIEVDGVVYPMTEKVRATIDATGDVQRLTKYATRPEKQLRLVVSMIPLQMRRTGRTIVDQRTTVYDNRELYLLLEGDEFAASVPMDPRRGAEGRELAAAINQAAKRCASRENLRDVAVRKATEAHTRALSVRDGGFKELTAQVEAAKADHSALLAARAALDAFNERRAEDASEKKEPQR